MFTRKKFDGLIFNWYGIDSTGAIAEFVAGFAPIPRVVFTDEDKYRKTESYFKKLLETTEEYLSLIGLRHSKTSYDNLFEIRATARKGLYSFCEPDPSTEPNSENYQLIALPNEEIKLKNLPEEIQNYLELTKFKNIVFKEIEIINITEHFQCDFGLD